jgi:hypothetical protein
MSCFSVDAPGTNSPEYNAPNADRRIAAMFNHCRPVKRAVSADKGMILKAILAI